MECWATGTEKANELGDEWKGSAEDGGCDLGDAASINVSEGLWEFQTGCMRSEHTSTSHAEGVGKLGRCH